MKSRIHAPESLEQRDLLTAQMVLDVNSEDIGVNPSFVTSFKDEIYFAANSGDTPEAEIWKSDGTVDGTQFVASLGLGEIVRMQALNDRLVVVVEIAGDHQSSTTGLFSSDGTQHGTVELVRTLDADNPFSNSLSKLVVSDDTAYVRAGAWADNDTDNFHAVYSTDGTLEGTRGSSVFAGFAQEPGELPRPAESGEVDLAALTTYHPNILEPTLAPTTRASELTLVNDRLFFSASGEDVGNELWEMDRDGTSRLVVDLNPGSSSSSPSQLVQHDGNLFFLANDGNGQGVWVLTDGSSSPQRLATADGSTDLLVTQQRVLFSTDSEDPNNQNVLYIDTSLEVSTVGTIPTDHDNLTWFQDSLVYTRQTESGQQLERLAGDELVSVSIGDEPDEFITHGDLLVFTSTTANGRELWTFDGSEATELDAPFRSGSITTDFELPDYFSVVTSELEPNGKALIGFVEGAARELTAFEFGTLNTPVKTLVTDGTPQGTRQLAPLQMTGWRNTAHEVDGEIFLRDTSSQWWSLEADANTWTGSSFADLEAADGRFEVIDFDPVTFSSDILTFNGENVPQDQERIQVGPFGESFPLAATSHGEYFLRTRDQSFIHQFEDPIEPDPYAELQVRRQDGTVEPAFTEDQLSQLGITSMPQNRNLFTGTAEGRLFAANDLIYFVAGTEEFGRELWQSDGTLEGTKMVRDILPGPRSSGVELLGVSGDTLFFMANDGVHGRELWSVIVDEAFSEEPLTGDLDDNGEVDFADFLAFSQAFGQRADQDTSIPSDFDGNGVVDFADFLLLSANFGKRV